MDQSTPSSVDASNILKPINGHANYYVSGIGIIYYKRGNVKFSTKVKSITKAKRIVEEELAKRSGISKKTFKASKTNSSNPTIQSVWDEMLLLRLAGKAHNTQRNYRKNWKKAIGPFFEKYHVRDINTDLIGQYKLWYLRHHKARYFEQTLTHLNVLLKYCVKMKLISEMPDLSDLDDIQRITDTFAKREKRGIVLNAAEQTRILDAALRQGEDVRHRVGSEEHARLTHRAYLGVLMGLRMGIRKMEAMSMKWSKIDLRSGFLEAWSSKNRKWRKIPIAPDLEAALRKQKEFTGKSEFLFPMPTDPERHLSGQVFDKVWVRTKLVGGFREDLRFHDLRHTFATMTGETGWPPIVACEILDMSLKIYQRVYCKASLDSKKTLIMKAFGDQDNGKKRD